LATENVFLLANSNTIELRGLRNVFTDEYINTANVVATLHTSKGVSVVTPEAITLHYVEESDGCYRALLAPDTPLEEGKRYKLHIVAQGEGLTATWEQLIQAKVRR